MLTNFQDWPADAITVEFWMKSVDKCRKGVPFSYATGSYEEADNSFLVLNYNDWYSISAPLCSPSSVVLRAYFSEHPCPEAHIAENYLLRTRALLATQDLQC